MSTATASTSSGSTTTGLDTAKLLLQKVVRGFYGPRQAILVDQLVKKEVFPADELSKRLGMQVKDVTKIAHRLIEDQLVQIHRRSEMRENGAMKALQRGYYYLDYSRATDVIKWRMYKIRQTVDVELRNELDAQGYVCPLCKATYTPLDADNLNDPFRDIFACSVCQTELVDKENEEDVQGKKERMQRLNKQSKSIVDLLKKLEQAELPRFNVEAYLAIHGPALGVTAAAAAEANGTAASAAAVVKIHMAGDDDEAKEKARREREVEEKRAQNALPSWIAQSTISADPEQTFGSTGSAAASSAGSPAPEPPVKPATSQPLRMLGEEAKPVVGAGAADDDQEEEEEIDLDAYYASLELAQPSEDSTNASTPALAQQVDTPALSPSVSLPGRETSEQLGNVDSPAPLKRERENEDEDYDSGASAKRAKQDDTPATASPALPSAVATPEAPAVNGEAAEDEEDEDEFDEFEPAEGGNADPNQFVSVGGKMLPFSQVTDEMTGEMTADEYSAYWEVYQAVNG
ncbi:Transcription initiation factor IIE subunit alpha [Rhodotorula toruloides]|uniref:BY PROTMAP: gi/472584969/gb/EMS22544.1/ transcription initiation factor TFIIE subunit alpha [Rhodosporidium toruloides NP11] gi/647400895/emb/CDR46750.1/ RHTO0S13e00958g1_1 [Rhodosporidium toruloides] n=1 Tax=Rhodotorula toruloides TaxID=5286 RepID=A0A0K3CRT1_RHOTO|nr:Transcription initiation factor IIE subunit alpha [Rhodotorula toruloides]PRQ70222.1 TFIIE alpha subunit-domain containing protein [Rhodotorula toruloides]